jgi:hypothetical protein
MLTWEAVTAISSAVSAVVILATVAVGYRQIRLAGDQLAHLRSSTQLDGTMKIYAELETPEFRSARLFVARDLESRMQDARFRDELLLSYRSLEEGEHKEIVVTSMFEKIGTYARHGLLDTVLIADYCGPLIREMWQKFESCGYMELLRRNNPYIFENFEFLYDAAMDWYDNDDPPFRTSRRMPSNAPVPSEIDEI